MSVTLTDKVRVGVVGLGYWGPNLARNFDRLPNAELAYCCDLDEANLAKARSLYPATTVTDDYAQLLGDDIIASVGQLKLGNNVPASVLTYRPM